MQAKAGVQALGGKQRYPVAVLPQLARQHGRVHLQRAREGLGDGVLQVDDQRDIEATRWAFTELATGHEGQQGGASALIQEKWRQGILEAEAIRENHRNI